MYPLIWSFFCISIRYKTLFASGKKETLKSVTSSKTNSLFLNSLSVFQLHLMAFALKPGVRFRTLNDFALFKSALRLSMQLKIAPSLSVCMFFGVIFFFLSPPAFWSGLKGFLLKRNFFWRGHSLAKDWRKLGPILL